MVISINAFVASRSGHSALEWLGKGSLHTRKEQFFFNIVQKAFVPPLSFEHYVVNFSVGILTEVRKRLSQQ